MMRPTTRVALLAHGGAPQPDPQELARLCPDVENRVVRHEERMLDPIVALFGSLGTRSGSTRAALQELANAVPVSVRVYQRSTRMAAFGSSVLVMGDV